MIAELRSRISAVSTTEAARALQAGEIGLVLDVREPDEYGQGHLPDAVNVPRGLLEIKADGSFPARDPAVAGARQERVLVYCTKNPSARSLLAAQTLTGLGFETVEVLDGGLNAWAESGLPVESSEPAPSSLKLGDTAPDFDADTSEGPIRFHEWLGDSWGVLFSHPKDFTPVCTTELGYMAKIKPEFDRRGVKLIGLSVDSAADHERWARDIEETQGHAPNYPIIADSEFKVSKLYGMLPADTSGDPSARTPADNQTVRNVFIIGPDRKVKLILVYPMTTGRNFDEVLRVIDSIQLTAAHRVATPVNWRPGEDVIIAGSVADDEAKELFGEWAAPRPYIRIVPEPRERELASR
jgi:alkyl hydroperoxide reductase subunit AhpC/rhodanese-related sulfurtransferase